MTFIGNAGHASEIPSRMERMAKTLVSGYQGKRGVPAGAVIAILPFNSSPRLSERHIGEAVSELLTRPFVLDSGFKVVERAALAKVLEEQHLQSSGAIDPESAVQVGRLLGARLLLLGSIDKLGDRYQVNARLVDANDGEVLSAAYEDFASRLFEEEARPFLADVPEQQTIGLYLLYNYRRNGNDLASYQTTQSGACVGGSPCGASATPRSFSLGLVGGGIRYAPLRSWILDLSVALLAKNVRFADTSSDAVFSGELTSGDVILLRGTVNRSFHMTPRFKGSLGAGLSTYKISTPSVDFKTTVSPSIRAGFEYRPQPRVGAGFFLNYDFLLPKGTDTRTPSHDALKIDGLSFEPTLAVYF
ncbi:MAG: hypothetical protein A2X36_10245 [Elusimicrobia bacterium GWA2_69_24]|nr:MAG: hypothetical protein A2X36_10245 [Elusimicrobia bacterium GWA2_69_24]